MPGRLYLISTPIGNLEDITLRALRILREDVSAIACEDTRHTQKLLEHFEFRKQLVSYHEHNEQERTPELIAMLERGESIALVSDAGTPLVSDPGYRLVRAAVESQIAVVPVPGPSAILAALAASGLPTDAFRFAGFVPPKEAARRKFYASLRDESATVIAYESPHRVLESLADAAAVLPDRPIALARELTKVHEEFLRGTAAEVHRELAARGALKGEFTLVIGKGGAGERGLDPQAELERLQAQEGLDRMTAIKAVAKRFHLPKREVYRLAEELGSNPPGTRHGSDRSGQ